MDDRAIARWRMHTMRLAGERCPSPAAVVTGLLGVQAENFRQASWAVATRTTDTTEAEFAQLFDDGVLLRTHVLRPTWHFVRPDDIRWLIELTGPRVLRATSQLQRSLELEDAELERAVATVVDALSAGEHLTRAELGERLAQAGLPSQGAALRLVMDHAELSCLVCSGALKGDTQTYALVDERAPAGRRLDRDEAVAELVLRYFTGHGPATERDLAYWATMTLTDVRAGLAAVGDQLDHLEHDGRTYWFAEPPPAVDAPLAPRAHLLLTLDEYHNGYQDSRYVLDVDGIAPRRRGVNVGMTLVDGQMVGDMRRTVRPSGVSYEVGLFRHLEDDEHDALEAAAERSAAFLGLEAALVTAPPDRQRNFP